MQRPVILTQMLDINLIRPNKFNPNRMASVVYQQLKNLVREKGIFSIDPILVRPTDNGYEIVDGEHRWLAAKEAGCKTIPVRIEALDSDSAKASNFSKNKLRGKIDPFALAENFQYEISRGLTQQEIDELYGITQGYVSRILRRLKVGPSVRKEYYRGNIGEKHIDIIAEIDDQEKQKTFCRQIVKQNLSSLKAKHYLLKIKAKCSSKSSYEEGENLETIPEVKTFSVWKRCPLCGHLITRKKYEEIITDQNLDRVINKQKLLIQQINSYR